MDPVPKVATPECSLSLFLLTSKLYIQTDSPSSCLSGVSHGGKTDSSA